MSNAVIVEPTINTVKVSETVTRIIAQFGATPISFSSATPQAVGTASAGSGSSIPHANHVHAHGNQLGGALHAVATTSLAGFESAADKTKLDALNKSDTAPQAVGTAAAGTSADISRADHVHAHGNQLGGSLHAVATTSTAGFESAADKTNLDALVAAAPGTTRISGNASMSASETRTIASFTVPDASAVVVEVTGVFFNALSGNASAHRIAGVFYRSGGSLTQSGSQQTVFSVNSPISFGLDKSGTSVIVTATTVGIAYDVKVEGTYLTVS